MVGGMFGDQDGGEDADTSGLLDRLECVALKGAGDEDISGC